MSRGASAPHPAPQAPPGLWDDDRADPWTAAGSVGHGASPVLGPAGEAVARGDAPPVVEVRRSRRRTRTVSAWREEGRLVVAIPARMSRAEERAWVERMTRKIETAEQRRRPSDPQLARRAEELSRRYLDGRARPTSVAWSSRQGRRWGSCTVGEASIRISDRLQGVPGWVLDYVVLHELVHLLHAGHGPQFWHELSTYPATERARGFLAGLSYAAHTGLPGPGAPGSGRDPGPGEWDDEVPATAL